MSHNTFWVISYEYRMKRKMPNPVLWIANVHQMRGFDCEHTKKVEKLGKNCHRFILFTSSPYISYNVTSRFDAIAYNCVWRSQFKFFKFYISVSDSQSSRRVLQFLFNSQFTSSGVSNGFLSPLIFATASKSGFHALTFVKFIRFRFVSCNQPNSM